MSDKSFCIEYARRGTASCKKCKQKLAKGQLRIAKLVANPFTDSGDTMKQWYHAPCLFDSFAKARASTRVVETAEDLDGWAEIHETDRNTILLSIENLMSRRSACSKAATVKSSDKSPSNRAVSSRHSENTVSASQTIRTESVSDLGVTLTSCDQAPPVADPHHVDNSFRQFRSICAAIAAESSYKQKTAVLARFLRLGSSGGDTSEKRASGGCAESAGSAGFRGDTLLWLRLLLPAVARRVYHLQSRQLVKLFSCVLDVSQPAMAEHLARGGDVAATVRHFFLGSTACCAGRASAVSLRQVDEWLSRLSQLSGEQQQLALLRTVVSQCTADDLAMFVRLVKADLRINAGAKHILAALHSDAYEAFLMSHNLADVVARCVPSAAGQNTATAGADGDGADGDGAAAADGGASSPVGANASMSAGTALLATCVTLMTPLRPMLAEACATAEQALKRAAALSPSAKPTGTQRSAGLLAEVKYDGERVQVHKRGGEFRFFSRSLKPVATHKVSHIERYVEMAFSGGGAAGGGAAGFGGGVVPHELILDGELLLMDSVSGQPLPFGTLGVHKRAAFAAATVCLFVFDCVWLNGASLVDTPLEERRRLLCQLVTAVPGRLQLSEACVVHTAAQIGDIVERALADGLEGVVLKPLAGRYEPGKRRWLKVKRDYLAAGSMADSADLVVLGAWYGTGARGGTMSVFLMGCRDASGAAGGDEDDDSACLAAGVWRTVTKVAGGHDDATRRQLQRQLKMRPVKNAAATGGVDDMPVWLRCARSLVPDLVVCDPRHAPVWQLIGAEFTRNRTHTADGISIRFPRVQRQRPDKCWRSATTLQQLQQLYANSARSSCSGGDFATAAGSHHCDTRSPLKRQLFGASHNCADLEPAHDDRLATGSKQSKRPKVSSTDDTVSSGQLSPPCFSTGDEPAPPQKRRSHRTLPSKRTTSPDQTVTNKSPTGRTTANISKSPVKQRITNAVLSSTKPNDKKANKNTSGKAQKSAADEISAPLSAGEAISAATTTTAGGDVGAVAAAGAAAGESGLCFAGGLPNTLRSARIVLDSRLPERAKVARYIAALDGLVVAQDQLTDSTHFVTSAQCVTATSSAEQASVLSRARRLAGVCVVDVDWLWHCVRAGKMLATDQFAV